MVGGLVLGCLDVGFVVLRQLRITAFVIVLTVIFCSFMLLLCCDS